MLSLIPFSPHRAAPGPAATALQLYLDRTAVEPMLPLSICTGCIALVAGCAHGFAAGRGRKSLQGPDYFDLQLHADTTAIGDKLLGAIQEQANACAPHALLLRAGPDDPNLPLLRERHAEHYDEELTFLAPLPLSAPESHRGREWDGRIEPYAGGDPELMRSIGACFDACYRAVRGVSPFDAPRIEVALRARRFRCTVARDSSGLTGFVTWSLSDGCVSVSNIAVRYSGLGRGVAERLVRAVAAESGARWIRGEINASNGSSRALATRLGLHIETSVGLYCLPPPEAIAAETAPAHFHLAD